MTDVTSGRRRWRRWGVELLLFVAIFLAFSAWQTRQMAKGSAPALVATRLDGVPFDLAAQRGRPVLVHFWAGWCPICKAEEGTIAELAASPQENVITVAMQSGDAAAVRALLQERGVSLPVIVDDSGTIADAWGVRGVPASFVVDGTGQILFREVGYTTGLGLRLRLWWAGHG